MILCCTKGGLISDSFSRLLESPQKWTKKYPEHFLFRWTFLGYLSKSEKLSEIEPPLGQYNIFAQSILLFYKEFASCFIVKMCKAMREIYFSGIKNKFLLFQ